ncbi:MAG TPA: cytochrome c [Jatrophihabitantaceae bacterium]|nr:cytochrome c [Jatrophihabitantaceae bacterium]
MTEDFDVEGELGFEPAVPAVPDLPPRPARTKRRGLRRRLGAAAVLLVGLASMGGAYAAFAGTSGASGTTSGSDNIAAGKQLYETSCITCHGANLQGVTDRGPSLLGVGGAAVYFQVSTGRMPLAGQGPDSERKTAKFDETQIDQIAAYVQSMGGGPSIPQGTLRDQDIAAGGELFRLNCASCHGTTGRGAPLSAGKLIPSLNNASDKQIYSAMQTGPEDMPIFSDNQLTPQEKREIVAYVQTLKASKDPGGNGIARIGPVSEAVVIWVGGIGVLMIAILWIGAKTQ